MKDFWIDFSASVKIEAKNKKEAKDIFWNIIPDYSSTPCGDNRLQYIEISEIEEGRKER